AEAAGTGAGAARLIISPTASVIDQREDEGTSGRCMAAWETQQGRAPARLDAGRWRRREGERLTGGSEHRVAGSCRRSSDAPILRWPDPPMARSPDGPIPR